MDGRRTERWWVVGERGGRRARRRAVSAAAVWTTVLLAAAAAAGGVLAALTQAGTDGVGWGWGAWVVLLAWALRQLLWDAMRGAVRRR
jgi:hypothetical protein